MSDISQSKLTLFRCLIAMAHSDRILDKQELAYIQEMIGAYRLTDEQKAIIEKDLSHAQKIEDLLPHLEEAVHRSEVVYFAQLMAFKDGRMQASEQDLLDKVHAHAMSKINMERIRVNIREAVAKEMNLYDLSVEKEHAKKGGKIIAWLEAFQDLLTSVGLKL